MNSPIKFLESRSVESLQAEHEAFLNRPNEIDEAHAHGLYVRYKHPVVTAAHTPLSWRFDLDAGRNPFLMERMGINATCNSGAIFHDGKYWLMVRVEGWDRKSFFGLCSSPNGVDNFRFTDEPILIDDVEPETTNMYDMRLVKHEDGWIYGLFCAERKDTKAGPHDTSAAVAQCGIARSKDLHNWERLPDLKTPSPQQRNVVVHPEFVDGKYALYTRPQDDFISAGSGGGIGWALCDSMENAVVTEETVIEPRVYHTINEVKNGQGPAPIKSDIGWIHLAHGVRNTAAGLRYVLYLFVADLQDPTKVVYRPGGYYIAPEGAERVGDVSNVAFSNGWIDREDGSVYIYYASADMRMHVAVTTVDRMVDYCKNTPEDGLTTYNCVKQRISLVRGNA